MKFPVNRACPLFNPWEHLNYFSPASLRGSLAEEGFKVVSDFGRARVTRDVCLQFDDSRSGFLRNVLRVIKRVATSRPSAALFCEAA